MTRMELNRIELNAKAIELRKQLGADENSHVNIFTLVNQIPHLTLMLYPLGKRISGICIKNKDANLIAINSSMSYGRQRYSLAHELFHLFYDDNEGVSISSQTMDAFSEIEKDADCFASYFLAPYNALRAAIQKKSKPLTMRDIISLEQYFGISHKAMLTRLVAENHITRSAADDMTGMVSYYAKQFGYDDKLYLPARGENQKRVYGNYIIQAKELKNRELISDGKYEELLLDAFRHDIVYNECENTGEIDD